MTQELQVELTDGNTRKIQFPDKLPAPVGLAIEEKADITIKANGKGGQAREIKNAGKVKADMHKALLVGLLDERETVDVDYSMITREAANDIWELYEDELELERAKN